MHTLWRGLVGTVFWSHERGSWAYDMMVAAIVLFVLFTPRSWFHDQPRSSEAPSQAIQLVSADSVSRTRVYRIDASVFAPGERATKPTLDLERNTHDVLGRSVQELKHQQFQIVQIDPGRAGDGSLLYYNVTVRLPAKTGHSS